MDAKTADHAVLILIDLLFPSLADATGNKEGANLTHPLRGTARNPSKECTKPHPGGCELGTVLGMKTGGFRSDRSCATLNIF